MGQTETTRQSDEVLPPIAGSIVKIQATATVTVVDLTTWPQTAALPKSTVKGSEHTNPLGQYVSLLVEPGGSTCYAAFAGTYAAAAAISATATTTIAGSGAAIPGGITVAGTEAFPLAPGGFQNFRLPPGPTSTLSGTAGAWGIASSARYMALICGSGNSVNVSGYVSSR